MTTTSFYPAKPLGCYGDGGAVFTDDDELAGKIRSLLVHGKGIDKYNNVRVGLNARLDTLQAAILIEKLKIFPEELEIRQSIAKAYTEALDITGSGIALPVAPNDRLSAWAQYTIRCEERKTTQEELNKSNIPSMVYYEKPAHLLDALAHLDHSRGEFPAAEDAAGTVLSLPFSPYLNLDQVRRIAEKLLLSASKRA